MTDLATSNITFTTDVLPDINPNWIRGFRNSLNVDNWDNNPYDNFEMAFELFILHVA